MSRRRRRNPGLGGVAMKVIQTALPALGTAAALGVLEVKVLGKLPKIAGILAKLGVGVAALLALPGKPQIAIPIACAAFATIGNDLGVKFAGGIVGGSKESTAKEMAGLAAEDEEAFGLVLTELQGMGILQVEGVAQDAEEAFGSADAIEADAF